MGRPPTSTLQGVGHTVTEREEKTAAAKGEEAVDDKHIELCLSFPSPATQSVDFVSSSLDDLVDIHMFFFVSVLSCERFHSCICL